MAQYQIQPTFTRGELSPRLHSRVDTAHWRSGLKTLENFIVMQQGGLRRRAGTKFIASTKTADKKSRLIPFEFSDEQAYALEFGESYIRLFANGGKVLSAGVPYEIVTTYTENDVFNIHHAQSFDVIYLACTGFRPKKLSRAGELSWTLADVEFTDGPYLDQNITTTTLGVTTPTSAKATVTADVVTGLNAGAGFAKTDVDKVFTYVNDLSETSYWKITAWKTTLIVEAEQQATSAGTGLTWNTSTTKLTLALTSASTTVTASAATGINGGSGFLTSDVGRWFRFVDAAAQVSCWKITARTSATAVTATLSLGSIASGTPASTKWRLGAWCDYCGWPTRVGFVGERLGFARTTLQPQTIWLSKAGSYEHHGTSDIGTATAIKDTDPLNLTLLSNEGNAVQWMVDDDGLLLGTQSALRLLGSSGGALTPTSVGQRRISRVGARSIQPLQIGQSLLYLGRFANQIRECTYSINQSGYVTPELSILSEHLIRSGVVSWAYAENPDGIAYAAVGNGDLVSVTYERDQQLGAMAPLRIAGSFGTRSWAVVESVCAIPGDTATELWMIVKRTIGGATKRYVERMEAALDDGSTDIKSHWYLDSALLYSGSAVSTVTGLDHLEGKTVGVLADGAILPDRVVADGTIALPRAASTILVGLRFKSKLKTMPLALSGVDGSTFGRKQKASRIIVDFMDTGPCQIGNSRGKEEVAKRSTATAYDTPEPLYTGFRDVKTDSSWSDYGEIEIETDAPLPVVIRSLTPGWDLES